MTDLIDHTLKHWRQSSMVYGKTDCLLSIATYAFHLGSPSALAIIGAYKGRYSSREEALALMVDAGGPDALIDLLGYPRCDPSEAVRGDIVIIDPGTGEMPVGALCTGDAIAARTERGVIEVARRHVKTPIAWKVG